MRVLINKQQLIELLKPTLREWAEKAGYVLPLTAWFVKHEFRFHDVNSFLSPYNGDGVHAVGSYDVDSMVIKLATRRSVIDVYSTIVHELAHAVQFYNLGVKFMPLYSQEAKRATHSRNKFENEARVAQTVFKLRLLNRSYGKLVQDFHFLLRPPKLHMYTAMHESRPTYEDYYNTRAFKGQRTKWWLRRQYGVN